MSRHARLLLALSLLGLTGPAPARAEEVVAAAERVAASLTEQLSKKLPRPGAVMAVAPVKESLAAQASGAGRAFVERLRSDDALGQRGAFGEAPVVFAGFDARVVARASAFAQRATLRVEPLFELRTQPEVMTIE